MIRVAFSFVAVCMCLFAPIQAQADMLPEQITGSSIKGAGEITCVNQLGVNAGCTSLPDGTLAVWRVLAFGLPVGMVNATLTFASAAGLATTHWAAIPADTFVETAPFDVALTRAFTSLSFTATLPQTVFSFPEGCCLPDHAGVPRYFTQVWTADSASVTGATSVFPPPLDLYPIPGVFVDTLVPVPEPTTLALVGTALTVVGAVAVVRTGNKHNGTRDTISRK